MRVLGVDLQYWHIVNICRKQGTRYIISGDASQKYGGGKNY